MQFSEALKKARNARMVKAPDFHIQLAAGCSPISLLAYLTAHLSDRTGTRRFNVSEAAYGEIIDSLKAAYSARPDGIALLLEYATLDPRLGLRRSSSWGDEAIVDILKNVRMRLELIRQVIAGSENRRTVIHLPTLGLPPVAGQGSWQISPLEASLKRLFNEFCEELVGQAGVFFATVPTHVLSEPRNVDGELTADFPYTQAAASQICEALSHALVPPVALKGIITDLDDTFWRGLVGEVGPEGVHWNLDGKSQIHAVYQQLLAACASRGILVGVASKNTQSVVDEALARPDTLIKPDQMFPILANWEPKSQSVRQILSTWNIGEDAVVFVDDNGYELDEVKRAFPGIRTLHFRPNDPGATFKLLCTLRDQCHKENASEEDKLRLASIRASATLSARMADASSMEEFLSELDATITFERVISPDDRRPFELLNKTNQFNLNGRRYSEGEWAEFLVGENNVVLAISYQDKFGALGKIGLLMGVNGEQTFVIDQWVLSCRAFGRRIEHATLHTLGDLFAPETIRFRYEATAKNGPTLDFLQSLAIENYEISAESTLASMPTVHAKVSKP